jgi:hypothetical protein
MIFEALSYLCVVGYSFLTVVCWLEPPSPIREDVGQHARRVREEAFPFIPFLAIGHYLCVVQIVLLKPLNIVFGMFWLAAWGLLWSVAYRNGGGGGRWKRRLRRLVERVATQGARLAVVRAR